MCDSVNKVIIGNKDTDGDWQYFTSLDEYGSINTSWSFPEAADLTHYNETELSDILKECMAYDSSADWTVMKCEVKCEPVVSTIDSIKELHQRKALSKLSMAEVESLGLNKLLVYIKTKFHGEE